jgi:restriction endonuclease S subunit
MKRNGNTLISIIDRNKLSSGIWDPFFYRENIKGEKLSDYTKIVKVGGKKQDLSRVTFEPIEYRHIPKGIFLTFILQEKARSDGGKFNVVGEQVLLFGTMRAYLGNVLITPMAEWVKMKGPIWFPVNAEFIQIIPNDNLIYFWWAFLKSPTFLHLLPTGSGGTRPRINIETLLDTPVTVPTLDIRKELHEELIIQAEKSWRNCINTKKLLQNIW